MSMAASASRRRKKRATFDELLAACERGDDMEAHLHRHMKLAGFSGAGKSHFALSFLRHVAKGHKAEEVLMTIIDCDFEGQRELIMRDDIVPPGLRKRIYRKVCSTVEEVNDYVVTFMELHKQHQEEHPDSKARIMVFENEGAFYLMVRDKYSVDVHGQSEADLLLSRQQQAIAQGKKTLPTYEEGQMHAYKVINRMFSDVFHRLKMGGEAYGFHFMSTVLLKKGYENYGQPTQRETITKAGRPDITDPLFDWIVEFDQRQKGRGKELETKHIATVRKSRTCKPFRIENPTQKEFWDAVEVQRKGNGKVKGK